MSDVPEDGDESPPIWMALGDLMTGILGVFVLFFVWAIVFQAEAESRLAEERKAREAANRELETLEAALAGPLAAGRITLVNGRIGIRGSVLFDLNSAGLRDEGAALLSELAGPLDRYLQGRDELVMVSGFTDDLPIHGRMNEFADNWELSTERALTVTRTLVRAGMPPGRLFAAGFGEHQPVTPNVDDASRARNRRVEIIPVPRRQSPAATP